MRCHTLRSWCLCIALVSLLVPRAAEADPAIDWPGFFGEPAERLIERSSQGDKHLYVFGVPYSWKTPVVWNYNDSGRNPLLTYDQAIQGIESAASKWTAVCQVRIQRGPDSTSPAQDMDGDRTSPGESVIGWGDLTQGVNGSASVAGVTWSYAGINASLGEFDLTMSPFYVTTPEQLDRVAVHELGHALGLAHSNIQGAVMSGPDSRTNPGVPNTTYNALAELTDDDQHGCLCLYGPSASMAGQGYLCGLPSVVAMGAVPVRAVSNAHGVTFHNASSTAALTLRSVSTGTKELVASGGCSGGAVLGPGQSCAFDLTFSPVGIPGVRATAYVVLATANGVGNYSFPVTMSASESSVSQPAAPVAMLTPPTIDFGAVEPGGVSALSTASLANAGGGIVTINAITADAPAMSDFLRSGTCNVGTAIAAGQSCSLQFRFAPSTTGGRAGVIEIATNAGTQQLMLTGMGAGGAAGSSTVVEYYNTVLDHYFITASPIEISTLDSGALPGWVRTGYTFQTFLASQPGTSPVCRYYIPPAQGDSHFFSVIVGECQSIPRLFPTFELEGNNVMYMFVPDTQTGACPSGSIPVYRVWNQRPDTNHRYTIDVALRDRMLARGYVAEGFGPDAVGMCAPR